MAEIKGLTGLRPSIDQVSRVSAPPYDIIKPGSGLAKVLQSNANSLYHVLLGAEPAKKLRTLVDRGALEKDATPSLYIYEQKWASGSRTGIIAAIKVDEYENKNIIRHEKTFDRKVKGRIALARETKHTTGPIFFLTKSRISVWLKKVRSEVQPLYHFISDFEGFTDLDQIENTIYKLPEENPLAQGIIAEIRKKPLYIADGHHRYHAALKNSQTHTMAYITEEGDIQAYNRVIKGEKLFSEIRNQLTLQSCPYFVTPQKNQCCIYTKEGSYLLDLPSNSTDVVEKLDCRILETELYSQLGISPDMLLDEAHFNYYPASELSTMKEQVDNGNYDIAVALHPVSIEELIAVADAGLENPEIVMPAKSTFFSPKILSGLFLYEHEYK
ncbi:DUF1015 family protein [bacterium]|nr:DUF1015 family protein [bacterium]